MEHDVVVVAKNLDFEFVKRFENSANWAVAWFTVMFSISLDHVPELRLLIWVFLEISFEP